MRQKLFTKEIDNMLFKQYAMGADLSKQKVVAKIFNPYGRGQWYIINSDPNDPDYLWAIVDLFEIEAGSVSREDLQTIKVPPFGLNLERDLYFQPINAQELYNRLRQGERFEHGGSVDVIQNDKDESYLTSVNAKPTDAAIKLAHGGMLSSEEKNRLEELQRKEDNDSLNKVENEEYENLVAKYRKTKDYKHYGKYADGGETDDYTKSLALVTVKFSNPEYNYSTNLSGSVSEADARKYFVGKSFNVGKYPKENMQKCIDIDFKAKGTYAKGGITKSYIYVPKSDIKEIDAVIGGKEQKISGKDVLDGAYVKKSVPKVDKVVKAPKGIDSKQRELNLQAKKLAESEGLTYDKLRKEFNVTMSQAFVEALTDANFHSEAKEFVAKLEKQTWSDELYKSEYYDAPPNVGYFGRSVAAMTEFDGYRISEVFIYLLRMAGSQNLADSIADLFSDSNDNDAIETLKKKQSELMDKETDIKLKANLNTVEGVAKYRKKVQPIKDELKEIGVKLEKLGYEAYAKGGVTFKDKVKSISNSLKGKKVPSKLKKDYGATYDKKESVLAATRIAGAMKAKMETKKKR